MAHSLHAPTRCYDLATVLPHAWRARAAAEGLRIFNPAIVHFRDRLLMAYRVDFGYDRPIRVACALCALDQHWQVVPGSVAPLSDTFDDGGNHYDPRFLVYQDRLFVHYNNNWDSLPNHIFLVEIDADTGQARSAPRPVALEGPRQPIEKNWMFFEHEGELLAIYQITPHVILRAEMRDSGPVHCRPIHRVNWDASSYAGRYGQLRGGTPPVRSGEQYVSIFHSRRNSHGIPGVTEAPVGRKLRGITWLRRLKRWLRERLDPVRYYGGLYAFSAAAPFTPLYLRPRPLLRAEQEERPSRPTAGYLAPRQVVYPCGLVRLDDDRWLASYGIHDERAALRVFSTQELLGHHQSEAMTAP